jgi:hypothetical protein
MVELNKANRKAPENDADLARVRAGFGVLRLRLGPMSGANRRNWRWNSYAPKFARLWHSSGNELVQLKLTYICHVARARHNRLAKSLSGKMAFANGHTVETIRKHMKKEVNRSRARDIPRSVRHCH